MADQNSVSAIVKNGEVTNLDNSTKSKNATPAGYDKDSFLQILVAQMKYQDPLEPTSNTEYINQYATFTQVEQLSNMANAMSLSRASEMVGKTVRITQVNGDTGEASVIEGVVDYVTFSGNKAYLNINGENYSIDDVTEVLDSEYTSAVKAVEDFQKAIDKLPSNLDDINEEEHGLTIDTMYNYYMNLMDEKARNMMNPNYVTALKQYVARIDEIRGDEYRSFKLED
ncbi:flagellar hook capping FlgD N-terminal domain-containing protein [Butyrivibrio sp. MC2021]|uniref:flagellar hook capping FlgD N-terminal domain-containing protein n=1 Tax=Butyrivibrio sp. MC2021 TaxID=1408306 RepID=UPI00068910B7|nr:flagellar hook capping FlgD N-terminal domain-containing protein [Butyrivibrio sp. MC2021]